MKDIKSIFRNIEKSIKQAAWFDDEWQIYNTGDYFQLYKYNWYNESQGGVHFETYIQSREIKQKSFPICIHAEEDCPSQQQFIKKFLEIEQHRINSWKGYQIFGNNYNICRRVLPLNFKNIEQRVFEEFNRLRVLELSIDNLLADLG